MSERNYTALRVVDADGTQREPRTNAQSTSGLTSSQRITPPLSRSNAMVSDSPNRLPSMESTLRMYPTDVPHRLAKAFCDETSSELRYVRMHSMRGTLPLGNSLSIPREHLPNGNRLYDAVMDVYEIRRLRLLELIAEAGTQVDVAAKLDTVRTKKIAPNYVSRMASKGNGRKKISGDMAQDLERAFKKPAGWMSSVDATSAASKPQVYWPLSVPIADFESLSPRARHDLDEAFKSMVVGKQAQELIERQQRKKKG